MSGEPQKTHENMLARVLEAATPLTLPELQIGEDKDGLAADPPSAEVRIELGRTRLDAEQANRLTGGTVVQLDETVGDPVRVYADGRLLARGELLVLEDRLCVRVNRVFA